MDLEGFARRRILKGVKEGEVISGLEECIREFKDWGVEKRREFSMAVCSEVKAGLGSREVENSFLRRLLSYPQARVSMGEFGVGSRGEGDFYIHKKLTELIGGRPLVGPGELDDGGVVAADGGYVTLAIDGFHSRLSEFPFIAGFHVARAALRDVQVMGSSPVAMMSDLHLADDGDVGKLFDFTAGVSAVGELTGVPLVSGSTLRIGGDMVFGDRLVAAVGAVGVSQMPPKARRNAREGDVILLTGGSGGGTIATIAIYNGFYDVVKETLNVEFHEAFEKLYQKRLEGIHTMSDVTNGGIRGDAAQLSQSSGTKLVFYEDALYNSINPGVLKMLRSLKIDPLGISTDSLLLVLPEEEVPGVVRSLRHVSKVYEVGRVEAGRGVTLLDREGEEIEMRPLFRESPYTRVKKVVGDRKPRNMMKMKSLIEASWLKSMQKKKEVLTHIRRS
jgi:hydrogenase expression/formation protein